MSVEIYICDLKPEVQEQVLSELNLSSDIWLQNAPDRKEQDHH